MQDVYLIIRYTRHWIHYGFMVHISVCTIVGAVKGLMGQ
jgi:hypothetical protein